VTEPVVHRVEHVYVSLSDGEAAYGMLTETLGLPIAWPYVAYGNFASDGVNLGNLNLEVLCHSDAQSEFRAHSPARIHGIALHPVATSRLLVELDHREIVHSPPEIFPPGASAETGAWWTNVTLERLSSPTTTVFTCEYHIPGVYDYDSRQRSLDEVGGGTLGVTGVREIVISSPEPTKATDRWQQLLNPACQSGPGYWELEHGPALRIIAGTADTVQVVVTVRSLAAVEQSGRDLVHALHGLAIRLVDSGR